MLRSTDIRKLQNNLSEIEYPLWEQGQDTHMRKYTQRPWAGQIIEWKNLGKGNQAGKTLGFTASKHLLMGHSNDLFISDHGDRDTEIMVTMPDEAATDIKLIKNLSSAGMDIAPFKP
ncbi:MAG: hypothetical protein R2814_04130 [Flavobacteriaceae bacterium]